MTNYQKNIAEDVELLPDPERIVNGLRDTGYNFNTAIADIVDNSCRSERQEECWTDAKGARGRY